MTLAERGIGAGAKELGEYSHTYSFENVFIRGRCFAVTRDGATRYEILVDGYGQYAVVDVPRLDDVQRRMQEAMEAFQASVELRGGTRSYDLR